MIPAEQRSSDDAGCPNFADTQHMWRFRNPLSHTPQTAVGQNSQIAWPPHSVHQQQEVRAVRFVQASSATTTAGSTLTTGQNESAGRIKPAITAAAARPQSDDGPQLMKVVVPDAPQDMMNCVRFKKETD